MGEVIGRRSLNGTMRRRLRAPEGIRPDVESVCVLVPVTIASVAQQLA